MRTVLQNDVVFIPGNEKIWMDSGSSLPPASTVGNVTARRILNTTEPISTWKLSPRESRVKFAYRHILVPESKAEAAQVLMSLNGAGIVFSNKPYSEPFPFGIVWHNFHFPGPHKSYGQDSCIRHCQAKKPRQKINGYIGNVFYQDGAKFHSVSPFAVVLAESWVRPLGKKMSVLVEILKKGNPLG